MKTLEDAWEWYGAVKEGTKRLAHLAKFWGDLPPRQGDEWATQVRMDNVLREVSATEMREDAELVRAELDDLAVLVLFSVFEAIVRDLIERQVKPEVNGLQHPALQMAGKEVLEAIAQGSFFRVLEPYKLADKDLVEQVNQVRRYRNWVAHGKRPDMEPAALVEPRDAYNRLRRFLEILQSPPPGAPT
jgi:hypothetical protein